jgi:CheY-like chemotaxis protein
VDFDLLALIGDAAGIVQGQADAKSLLLRRELALDLPRYVRRPDPPAPDPINLLGNAMKFTAVAKCCWKCGAPARRRAAMAAARSTSSSATRAPASMPTPAPPVPEIRAGRPLHHAPLRRHGPGPGHLQGAGRADGRHDRRGKPRRHRLHFHFTCRWPRAARRPRMTAWRRATRTTPAACVLCAEDVRTNQIIGTLLEGMGHAVTIVENGEQALRALSTDAYDCVLMDGRMPMMDGEQAARLIRDGGSAQFAVPDAQIPIIALTANASDHDRQRYLACGMDGFLSKPVDEALLFDKLDTVIDLLLARGHALPPALPAADDALARQFGLGGASGTPGEAAPSPADPMAPVHILPLAGLSPQHLQRIAQAFLDEAPRRLDLAGHAVRDGNASAAAAAIHALKGSAGYLSRPTCTAVPPDGSPGVERPARSVEQFLPQLQALDEARRDLRSAGGRRRLSSSQ